MFFPSGPKGIWTAEKKKIQAASSLPFHEAIPTYTHMAIRQLVANGFVKFVVSQNIDGLHVRSGLSVDNLAELHGNVFMEECKKCHALVQRNSVAPTIGRRATGGVCAATRKRGTPCRYERFLNFSNFSREYVLFFRGALVDTVLDWCSALPEVDLSASVAHSR
jgi:NAD+-dependent protein deacetylase sirtuin 6